jgi:hypothetical protein
VRQIKHIDTAGVGLQQLVYVVYQWNKYTNGNKYISQQLDTISHE